MSKMNSGSQLEIVSVQCIVKIIKNRGGSLALVSLLGHVASFPNHISQYIGRRPTEVKKFLMERSEHFVLNGDVVKLRNSLSAKFSQSCINLSTPSMSRSHSNLAKTVPPQFSAQLTQVLNVAAAEGKMIEFLRNILKERKGSLALKYLVGYLGSLPQDLAAVMGRRKDDLVKFVKEHAEFFILNEEIVVLKGYCRAGIYCCFKSNPMNGCHTICLEKLDEIILCQFMKIVKSSTGNCTVQMLINYSAHLPVELKEHIGSGQPVFLQYLKKFSGTFTVCGNVVSLQEPSVQSNVIETRPVNSIPIQSTQTAKKSPNLQSKAQTHDNQEASKIVEFFIKLLKDKGGSIPLKNLAGHISQLPKKLRCYFRCENMKFERFLKMHNNSFTFDGEKISLVTNSAPKVVTPAKLNGDFVSNIAGQGQIVKLLPYRGVISFEKEVTVLFGVDVFYNEEEKLVDNLEWYLKLGDQVNFEAVPDPSDSNSKKWLGLIVWKGNKPKNCMTTKDKIQSLEQYLKQFNPLTTFPVTEKEIPIVNVRSSSTAEKPQEEKNVTTEISCAETNKPVTENIEKVDKIKVNLDDDIFIVEELKKYLSMCLVKLEKLELGKKDNSTITEVLTIKERGNVKDSSTQTLFTGDVVCGKLYTC